MGARDNKLTLESLAQRLEALQREHTEKLEALERENQRIRSENAELRHKVATLEGSGTSRDEAVALRGQATRQDAQTASGSSGPEGEVSRRWLLSKAGAAAMGSVAAGALMLRGTPEARAHSAAEVIQAHQVITHTLKAETHAGINTSGVPVRGIQNSGIQAAVSGTNAGNWAGVEGGASGSGPGVYGVNDGSGPGVYGTSANSIGVHGTGKNGVYGESATSDHGAVVGRNNSQDGKGLYGEATSGIGVHGTGKNGVVGTSSTSTFSGVFGRNDAQDGVGVLGGAANGYGVQGYGNHVGVYGRSPNNSASSVWGEHPGSGKGVWGTSAQGTGVSGESASGYGGQFGGGKAQLKLVPAASAGKPTTGTHTKGEIYMDKAGALFVCTAGDGTSVGTWKKIRMVAV